MPEMNEALAEALAPLDGALTPSEVAVLLRRHVTTVYRLIKSGRLETIATGSGVKRRTGVQVPQDAVVNFLRQNGYGPVAELEPAS